MPTSLSSLTRSISTRTVVLPHADGNRSVVLRALTARQSDEIADLFPRPTPPLGKNPLAGSDAPPVPREDDVGYRRALSRWFSDLRTAEIAVAMDLVHRPDKAAADTCFADAADKDVWLRSAVAALKETFSEPELRLLAESLESLSTRSMVQEAIRILIVEADGEPKADSDRLKIPEQFDTTEQGVLLSAAARFGVGDPFKWIDGLDAGQRSMAIAAELIRRREEADRAALVMSACRVAGGL